MVKIAAYLEHNGVAGVKPAHVKDVSFWERMDVQAKADRERIRQEREQEQEERRKRRQAKAEAIQQCREQVASRVKERGSLLIPMPRRKRFSRYQGI